MKCLLLADDRPALLDTLEPILKHWGYRVLTATDATQVKTFLAESPPVLMLIGTQLLADPALQLPAPPPLLLALAHPEAADPQGVAAFAVPVDIFALFAFIQQQVEQHPRHNLRVRLRLPGMYRRGKEEFMLAELLSLSKQGLFFRSPMRLKVNDRLTAIIPLLGHGKELEIEGAVLYIVEPTPENGYMQGFGMGFTSLDQEQLGQLENFIESCFLSEVANCQAGVGTFSLEQLRR